MRRARKLELAARADARRERENSFPRLAREAPSLHALSIRIAERVAGSVTEHVRHVVVASAPALFESRCATCSDGMHEYTAEVVRGLKRTEARIAGESSCNGMHAAGPCTCVLHYDATASYRRG